MNNLDEEYVTVLLICTVCKRQCEFKDETFPDCYWQANMEGWEDDTKDGYICPICSDNGGPGRGARPVTH